MFLWNILFPLNLPSYNDFFKQKLLISPTLLKKIFHYFSIISNIVSFSLVVWDWNVSWYQHHANIDFIVTYFFFYILEFFLLICKAVEKTTVIMCFGQT